MRWKQEKQKQQKKIWQVKILFIVLIYIGKGAKNV